MPSYMIYIEALIGMIGLLFFVKFILGSKLTMENKSSYFTITDTKGTEIEIPSDVKYELERSINRVLNEPNESVLKTIVKSEAERIKGVFKKRRIENYQEVIVAVTQLLHSKREMILALNQMTMLDKEVEIQRDEMDNKHKDIKLKGIHLDNEKEMIDMKKKESESSLKLKILENELKIKKLESEIESFKNPPKKEPEESLQDKQYRILEKFIQDKMSPKQAIEKHREMIKKQNPSEELLEDMEDIYNLFLEKNAFK